VKDENGPQPAGARPGSMPRAPEGPPEGPVDSEMVTRADTSRDARGDERIEAIVDRVRDAGRERHARIAALGAGGMGTVELVSDRSLERRTVMKRIHEHLATDPRAVKMFVREAQITGQLEHPNIVPVHELGVLGDFAVYFTMKLVEGRTLEQVVRELPAGPLEHGTLMSLLEMVLKVCDALSFAHSRGVIHCDVKPANVMVGDFGEVYLMDWGVARRAGVAEPGDSEPVRAGTAVLVGTPSYMAPEQALGRNDTLDERTDVFAIGAMIYHLLARRPPYGGEHFWGIVSKAQSCEHVPLDQLMEEPPPRALARIVSRAMSREPGQRHPSVAALRQELLRFVRGGDSFPVTSFAAGETIVREGEPGDAAYILRTGRCQVSKIIEGETIVLRTMEAGEVFGEMAILAPGPRTATVIALEPTTLHVVTAETLEREVEAMKPWMGAFVRTLAKRFREREESKG